jgi:hypothetical protein
MVPHLYVPLPFGIIVLTSIERVVADCLRQLFLVPNYLRPRRFKFCDSAQEPLMLESKPLDGTGVKLT